MTCYKTTLPKFALLATLVLGILYDTQAQHDYLIDETYGDGGQKVINWGLGDMGWGAMDSSDRALIVCSDYTQYYAHTSVIRLNTDGQFDASFNPDSPIPGAFAYHPDSCTAAYEPEMIQTIDGKIVVANGYSMLQPNGQINHQVHVFRLNSNGTLDTTFAESGILIIQDDFRYVWALHRDDLGYIYLGVGNSNFSSNDIDESRLVKINSFGEVVNENFAFAALDQLRDIYTSFRVQQFLVEENWLYIAARGEPTNNSGLTLTSQRQTVFFRVDLNTGLLDMGFGDDGVFAYHLYIEIGFFLYFLDVVSLDQGGKLLLFSDLSNHPSRLIRLTSDGSIDTSYGEDGIVVLDYPASQCNHFSQFAKHPSYGWYITSANWYCGPETSLTLSIAQLNDQGEPILMDNGYGSIEVGSYFEPNPVTTTVQSDGKLVVIGYFFNNGPPDLKAMRINAQLESSIDEGAQQSEQPRITAFPNPASTVLTVQLNFPEHTAPGNGIEWVMHDLQGRVVYRQNHPEIRLGETTIDVSGFQSGLYTLHCIVNGVWVDGQKVVVE